MKKGILLQLFGGNRKDFSWSGRGQFRSELNILMPRSQYTSGKGSSAVGLTAYVTKVPETCQLILQTRAVELVDNGVSVL